MTFVSKVKAYLLATAVVGRKQPVGSDLVGDQKRGHNLWSVAGLDHDAEIAIIACTPLEIETTRCDMPFHS